MTSSVIVAASRTPVARFGSALRSRSAVDLGAVAIRDAVARSTIAPTDLDFVVMGHVLQAGAGQITARQAAIAAGIPREVPGADPEQRVPLEPDRDRVRRPADPRRRARDRRRGRDGVDDQRSIRPSGRTLGWADRGR